MVKILFGLISILLLLCLPAQADTAQTLQIAAADYRDGHVLDAETFLQDVLSTTTVPADRWAIANLLTDICTYSYDFLCVDHNVKSLQDAATALNQPQLTSAKVVFVIAFDEYLRSNVEFFRQNGMDFSQKVANPLSDPALATRLFLLNAAVDQDAGNFAAAHHYIDRAFASFLRIDNGKDMFETASLLKELISVALGNHDTARAIRWAITADPIIRAGLSPNSFDYAHYLALVAQITEILRSSSDATLQAFSSAAQAMTALQIAPYLKDAMVSNLTINQAVLHGLRGENRLMHEKLNTDPFHARRAEIIRGGAFTSFNEMFYAAAEIFFDALSAQTPDQSWKPLFEKLPNWNLSVDMNSQGHIYAKVALAALKAKSDPNAARQLITDAGGEDLAQFERGRTDIEAFPLPSLLDQLILTIAAGSVPPNPGNSDADLLLGGMELMNRNTRYVISDTMAALAAQDTDELRHATHALLRLSDRQAEWETARLRELATRIATHQEFPVKDFTPQLTAINFDQSLTQLQQGIKAPPNQLPKMAELQSALGPDEAFIGYFPGLTRICVRRNGFWNSHFSFDQAIADAQRRQLSLDLKLLSASLSVQNAPSDTLDAQFPVSAAMRLYHLLFDGLDTCLSGAHHVIYSPSSDLAAIPPAILLRDQPVKLGDGYNLATAHWLVLDYAFSTVTSVRDFLSSRRLSLALQQRPNGGISFAGIGDPKLNSSAMLKNLPELPETRTEINSIAKLFKTPTDIKVGDAATEEAFRGLPLDQYQIIHFATHGLIRNDVDGLSQAALVFTPGDTNSTFTDGLLTASDVANLNLSARLIVLSACNTANFDPTIFASPLQGLASAFAAAGAPTTVASLWSVNNTAGLELMVDFYGKLLSADEPSVAVAMQQAMIKMLHDARSIAVSNPRFWAPFIVMGDGGVKIRSRSTAPSYESATEISTSGGEIMGIVRSEGGLVRSEIGPITNGRHSSVVQSRGSKSWRVEDRLIGAGQLTQWKDVSIVAGYFSRENKAIPVVRAFSRSGQLLWRSELVSRFDSAIINSLVSGPGGVYAVVAPMTGAMGKIDFDIVHLDTAGKVLNLRAITTAQPDAKTWIENTVYAARIMGGSLIVTASYSPQVINFVRNDFGFNALCAQGRGAHFYWMNATDLAPEKEIDLPGVKIFDLQPAPAGLVFAGAEQSNCAWDSERPILGHLSDQLQPTIDWKGDDLFYGHLVAIAVEPNGYVAAASFTEPLDVPRYNLDALGKPVPVTKYAEYSDRSLSEAVLLRFDARASLKETSFLGNGLPEFAQGLLQTGSSSFIVYGSDGFNPWVESLN
ncbi:MAG: CHAT domain-containing protein [Pseudomonadota bacterium]